MIEGFLTLSKIKGVNGGIIPARRAVEAGLVRKACAIPDGWGIGADEVPLGYNTMVDNGRQLLAYLFGGRTPASSYSCSRFGIGTGTGTTSAAYTDLESPLLFYDDGVSPTLLATKPINNVDYPVPFVSRVELELGADEAVGAIITEWGLYAYDSDSKVSTLLCRKLEQGIEKTAGWAPVFCWRLRW